MSDLEVARRTAALLQDVEKNGFESPADGMRSAFASMRSEVQTGRDAAAALGSEAGAKSTSTLFYQLGQEARDVMAEVSRVIDTRGPGFGG